MNTHNAVRDGAAFLDDRKPGWVDSINLDSFNIQYATQCILGQVYNNYYTGLDALALATDDEAMRYGFFTDGDGIALQDAWAELITTRREQAAVNANNPSYTLTKDQLVDLVTRAMDYAHVRGDYSEIGLTASFLMEHDLM